MSQLHTSAGLLADLVSRNLSCLPPELRMEAYTLTTRVHLNIFDEMLTADQSGAPLPPSPPPGPRQIGWLPRIIDGGRHG